MKKLIILMVVMLTGCATSNKFLASPGLPILNNNDLATAHAILTTGIANGAGAHIKHADSCVVAFLAHPEYQSGLVNAKAVVSNPLPAASGPISNAATLAVNIDVNAKALESKVALVEAGLPDDVVTGCALLVHDFSAPGIIEALNRFLHPATTPNVQP